MSRAFVVFFFAVSICAFVVYIALTHGPSEVIAKGSQEFEQTAVQYITLATAIASMMTAIIGLLKRGASFLGSQWKPASIFRLQNDQQFLDTACITVLHLFFSAALNEKAECPVPSKLLPFPLLPPATDGSRRGAWRA